MSQMLVSKKKLNESLLFQDLYYSQRPTPIHTSVTDAICSVCKKGLNDGTSVTAISINKKIRLYCQNHFPR